MVISRILCIRETMRVYSVDKNVFQIYITRHCFERKSFEKPTATFAVFEIIVVFVQTPQSTNVRANPH